ncbi:MAG TPA: ParB/RepB/Spo0J family partition protein [Roseiflexaceae bacterium]|jgi:ParB family chromosome partitioning protein|nr:ParB/RepB/Spo0J family partition protein [Roseiflexaceae bacterium]
MQLLYLDPHMIDADPEGVRENPGDIDGLAATIAEQGLLQPLGVVEAGHGRYRVVYGNRRREASLQLGLEKVPCILLDEDDPRTLLQQITENMQRQDLNDLEKARAFLRLRERMAETTGKRAEGDLDEETGKAVGLSARTIRRYLGLLELPEEIQAMLRDGELSVTQAQHLRRIPNQRTQLELAQAAVDEGMSAAELSRLSSYFAANPNLTLDAALEALQQGVELQREKVGVPAVPAGGGPLSKTSTQSMSLDDDDSDLWDDEDEVVDEGGYLGVEDETVENQPKNKARVFRIRSLDQMIDETDRLARAHVEGDLTKWVTSDEGAPFKIRLMVKQLNSLLRALRETATQQGWELEE